MGSVHKIEYFTLFYCEKHMCGCVLNGDYENVPEWHQMCGNNSNSNSNCDWTYWIKNGLISFDEINVEVLESPIDFGLRDGCGFDFHFHIHEFYNENGALLLLSDSPLKTWFENYSEMHLEAEVV